jgi:hypothetical protein
MATLPIADVGNLCAHLAIANRAIAHRVGTWVATTTDPALQQLFALAGHRHAWHAELWDGRRPTVPLAFVDDPISMPDAADDGERRAAYVDVIERFRASLADVTELIDGVLDPATARVVSLVSADLGELLARVER